MTIIPKEQIEEDIRNHAAFSNAADDVVATVFEIRKTPGNEDFKGSPIEVGKLEASALKDQLVAQLSICQEKAVPLSLDFAQWQIFTLPQVIEERAQEQEQPEGNN